RAADPGSSSCRRSPIQVVLGDVLHNTIGDQVPHREAPADSLTALRRGDRQGGHFERAYASLRQSANVQGMSWARYRHKVSQLPEFSHVLPLQDLRHRICAADEEQFGVRMLL